MRNSIRKKITSFVIAFCLILTGVGLLNFGVINLKSSADSSQANSTYFYAQLSNGEKRFYESLEKMNTSGVLKTGEAYDLVANKVVSQNEIFEYSDGNSELLKQFRAAKDAFQLDHPEVFWVDFDALALSLGQKGNKYTASIDAGRYESYIASDFNVETLEDEISDFYGEDGIEAYLPTDETLTEIEIVEEVATLINQSARLSYVDSKSLHVLNSAYGVVSDNQATASGLAETFKICMDLMNIECIKVEGYVASNKADSLSAHCWNYVKIEGNWYAVDIALNELYSVNTNVLCGKEFLNTHLEDMLVSTDSKVFELPKLAKLSYYASLLTYSSKVDVNNGEFITEFSFNGKSATELVEDGLYLVVFNETSTDSSRLDFGQAKAWVGFETDASLKSEVAISLDVPLLKIGVTKIVPNAENVYDNLTNSDLLCFEVIENTLFFEGTEETGLKRPWIESVKAVSEDGKTVYNDATSTKLDVNATWNITIVYDEALRIAAPTNPIDMRVGLLNQDEDIKSYVTISDVVWSEETANQISFKFKPSQLSKHKNVEYVFMPFNFMNTSGVDVRPLYAKLTFEGKLLSASKLYTEEKLYVSTYTKPTLVDTDEIKLIEQGWRNESSATFNENQRELMTLVSSKSNESVKQEMINGIKSTFELQNSDILASDAFDLHIGIDGIVSNIPVNVYLQYAFAYPAGYSYSSLKDGIVFKAISFEKDVYGKYDYTKAVELMSVATKSGIIVSANASENIVIVALNSNNEQVAQKVYARAINAGGTIECVGEINTLKKISVASGESISYSIVADTGYQIDYVLFNGKNVTKNVKNGTLMILKADLTGNNVVEVAFVEKTVVEAEKSSETTNLDASYAANEQVNYVPREDDKTEKSNTLLIVIIVSVSAAIAIAAVVTTIIILKKKVLKNKK